MKLSFTEKALIIVAIDKEINQLSPLTTISSGHDSDLIRFKLAELKALKKRFLK